jgi:predicted Zn-dependent protease
MRKLLVALIVSSSITMGCAQLDIGDLLEIGGDIVEANKEVSTEEEIELGGNLISGLLGAAPLVDDPELQRYVNDVGFWVASQSKRKDLPWRFGVIDSPNINAFAAPGGYIVITFGLFSLLENEAQLAGVLGHEISHVVKRHHLEALQKTLNSGVWAKIGVRALADKDSHEALDKVVNAGVQLYASGLDRELEYESDKRGVVLAARAGYDPYALLDVLTTIDSINPSDDGLSVMLNTHPPTGVRLQKLVNLMDGQLDRYADGQINQPRFAAISSNIKP